MSSINISDSFNTLAAQKFSNDIFVLNRFVALCKNNPDIVEALVSADHKDFQYSYTDILENECFREGIEEFFELAEDRLDAIAKGLPRPDTTKSNEKLGTAPVRMFARIIAFERYYLPTASRVYDFLNGDGLNDKDSGHTIRGYKAAYIFAKKALAELNAGAPFEKIIEPFMPENKEDIELNQILQQLSRSLTRPLKHS